MEVVAMKIGKKHNANNGNIDSGVVASKKPGRNQSKKSVLMIAVIVVTALLITWVYTMGRKATDTVTVVMTSQSIYKNQQITESMLQPYDMVQAEFEKYATVSESGAVTRRILLWDEASMIIGSYAAYPLQANTLAEYRSFYKSKIDNSDSVLYSFPGKEIVSLDIATDDLQTFKTFLEPGDRITITAVYTDEETVRTADGMGGTTTEKVETYKSEKVFQDIFVADLLNTNGDSILDIYEDYNGRSVAQQAALDASTSFQDSVEPKSLLVALTPEEKDLYYYYLSKQDVTFRMSLPQRVE